MARRRSPSLTVRYTVLWTSIVTAALLPILHRLRLRVCAEARRPAVALLLSDELRVPSVLGLRHPAVVILPQLLEALGSDSGRRFFSAVHQHRPV